MKIDLNVLWKTPNAKPLYQQLKELVQGAILAGIYLPGEKLESEREFIEKGNLSYPTVSRALRELAQEGYIIRKVGSGSFVRPHFPMVPSQIKNIVAIYYNLDTPYFKRLRSGIEAECRARDIRLHCIATGLTLSEEKRILTKELKSEKFDAILGYPFGSMELNLRLSEMIDKGIPVVMIGSFFCQFQCDSVSPDYETGSENAAAFLLEHGYDNIIHTGVSPKFPFNILQIAVKRGIKNAISASGYANAHYHKLSFSIGEKGNYPREYWRQLLKLCDTKSKTGIICDSDAVARDVIDFLTARKIAIPDQVAIIGAGDLPLYTMRKPLRLSTVAWPLERMGREAVRRLLVQKDNTFDSSVRIIMDTTLILRDTTPKQLP
jgi:GntR family transcriptional regulator of arabinose operon